MTTERRTRRPHAASGGRLVVAGLSTGAAVALVATMAAAPGTTPVTPAAPTVVVGSSPVPDPPSVRRAPPVRTTPAPPVTSSQAS